MKSILKYLFIIIMMLMLVSCNSAFNSKLSAENASHDTIYLNDDLKQRLEPVLENSKRINSIKKWSEIKSSNLMDTAEGGEAKLYYKNGKLEKITTHYLGETFQKITVYHLSSEKLSFVFDKFYQYNRPVFYDSIAMKSNNDTEFFDLKKAVITETRYYFLNDKLVHHTDSEDCGAPFDSEYLNELQKEIEDEFKRLKVISQEP